jgi:hypothetical protein
MGFLISSRLGEGLGDEKAREGRACLLNGTQKSLFALIPARFRLDCSGGWRNNLHFSIHILNFFDLPTLIPTLLSLNQPSLVRGGSDHS